MRDEANAMGEFLKRFPQLIGEAVRLLVPGLLLIVLFKLSGHDVLKELIPTGEYFLAWALVLVVGAGIVVYTVHRYVVHFLVEIALTRKGVTPIAQIQRNFAGLTIAAARGRFLRLRWGERFMNERLSEQLLNTWAYNHLLWMVGELFVGVSVVVCVTSRAILSWWLVAFVAGLLIMSFGLAQSWQLFGAESEIWRETRGGNQD